VAHDVINEEPTIQDVTGNTGVDVNYEDEDPSIHFEEYDDDN